MSRTWLITGASRGLGRAFALAALRRGDRVVATAREVGALEGLQDQGGELLRLALDVTEGEKVRRVVGAAAAHFDGLDVVVNNAGAADRGAVEELPDDAFRAALEVNLFGPLSVSRACLPIMRAQGHGHLVQISSLGGLIAVPLASAYVASKWALEGLSEAMAQEVARFGVRTTIVEPAAFRTAQGEARSSSASPMPEYDELRDALAARPQHVPPGDPADAALALLRVVDAPDPPLRVVLGKGGTAALRQVYAQRLAGLEAADDLLDRGADDV